MLIKVPYPEPQAPEGDIDYQRQLALIKTMLDVADPGQPVEGLTIPLNTVFVLQGVTFRADSDTEITGTKTAYIKLTISDDFQTATASFVGDLRGNNVAWNPAYAGYYDPAGSLYIFDESYALFDKQIDRAYRLDPSYVTSHTDQNIYGVKRFQDTSVLEWGEFTVKEYGPAKIRDTPSSVCYLGDGIIACVDLGYSTSTGESVASSIRILELQENDKPLFKVSVPIGGEEFVQSTLGAISKSEFLFMKNGDSKLYTYSYDNENNRITQTNESVLDYTAKSPSLAVLSYEKAALVDRDGILRLLIKKGETWEVQPDFGSFTKFTESGDTWYPKKGPDVTALSATEVIVAQHGVKSVWYFKLDSSDRWSLVHQKNIEVFSGEVFDQPNVTALNSTDFFLCVQRQKRIVFCRIHPDSLEIVVNQKRSDDSFWFPTPVSAAISGREILLLVTQSSTTRVYINIKGEYFYNNGPTPYSVAGGAF